MCRREMSGEESRLVGVKSGYRGVMFSKGNRYRDIVFSKGKRTDLK